MKIISAIKHGRHLPIVSEGVVKTEPMLHRATRNFSEQHGGPLTREFLKSLEWPDSDSILIDSRVHMLMPGMYPCIPGWHHDDVPRERSDGQPNYVNPSYKAQHCMALWGDCSLTEFAIGEHDIEIPEIGNKIYKSWHPQVEALCASGSLVRYTIPAHRMIYFDWQSWHRGVETTKRGFRFFIRATRYSGLSPRNEIRHNANVYMPVIEEGW